MAHAETRLIHQFTSGRYIAAVEENSTRGGKTYHVIVRDASQPEDSPSVVVDAGNLRDFSGVCSGAGKLIEYLAHGFSYEAWREDCHRSQRPDHAGS